MSDQAELKRQEGKLIIGLTGNIATGKSAVMRLAADQGALTIDADKLIHEIMNNDTETQAAIVMAFGDKVRRADGRIDRKALGSIVFNDKAALRDLEEMTHPIVRRRVYQLIDETDASIIMIEAIKLLEGDLSDQCHQIWVTRCSQHRQLERLRVCRGMDTNEAAGRIKAQPPQEEKVALADVVIETDGLMSDTERQFDMFWQRLPDPATVEAKDLLIEPMTAPKVTKTAAAAADKKPDLSRLAGASAKLNARQAKEKAAKQEEEAQGTETADTTSAKTFLEAPPLPDGPFELVAAADRPDNLDIRRARPSDIPSILLLIHKATDGTVKLKRADIMMALSERSYFIGQVGSDITAVMGWSIESGVTQTDEIYIHPPEAAGLTGAVLIEEIEKSAFQHMCEILVVYLKPDDPPYVRQLYEAMDYRAADITKMVGSWRQSIREAQPDGTYFLIKILAERESHPI
jgi:dephospho-CoA kinase